MPRKVTEDRYGGDDQSLEGDVKTQAVGKDAFLPAPGRTLHHARFRVFHPQGDCGKGIGNQVDPEDMHGFEDGESHQRGRENREHLRQVRGEQELDGFADVVIDPAAFAHRGNDGGEVIVR